MKTSIKDLYTFLKCIDNNCEFKRFADASNEKNNRFFIGEKLEKCLLEERLHSFIMNKYDWARLKPMDIRDFHRLHMRIMRLNIKLKL